MPPQAHLDQAPFRNADCNWPCKAERRHEQEKKCHEASERELIFDETTDDKAEGLQGNRGDDVGDHQSQSLHGALLIFRRERNSVSPSPTPGLRPLSAMIDNAPFWLPMLGVFGVEC